MLQSFPTLNYKVTNSLKDLLKWFIVIRRLAFVIKVIYTYKRPSFHVYAEILQCFHELLIKDGTMSFHYQNVQKLRIKRVKAVKGKNPEILNEVFFAMEEEPSETQQKRSFRPPQ